MLNMIPRFTWTLSHSHSKILAITVDTWHRIKNVGIPFRVLWASSPYFFLVASVLISICLIISLYFPLYVSLLILIFSLRYYSLDLLFGHVPCIKAICDFFLTATLSLCFSFSMRYLSASFTIHSTFSPLKSSLVNGNRYFVLPVRRFSLTAVTCSRDAVVDAERHPGAREIS